MSLCDHLDLLALFNLFLLFLGSLRGLLGDFDENPNNDLQTDSGRIFYPNSSTEQIFEDFGVPCNKVLTKYNMRKNE